MKSTLLAIAALFISFCCKAQEQITFPFQGGASQMTQFFKDSLVVSPEMIQQKATGVAVFKFTADESGNIKKIIIYYADDYSLTPPIIEALRKSNHKWIIPNHEKLHDFLIPFTINFNPPATGVDTVRVQHYNYYQQRKPILSLNQIPIVEDITLLPTIVVNYDIP